jgi:apolipoprotein N-acyltransferase
LKLEGALGMAAALVGIAGLVFIAPGPERNTQEPPRRGWIIGLVLVGIAFFWIGLLGVID